MRIKRFVAGRCAFSTAVLVLAAQVGLCIVQAAPARAASGDFVAQVAFSQQCSSGLGVGIAYDGANLWYTCYASSPDLLRANPTTGAVSASYNISGGLGAIAFDATRNAIWAAPGGGAGSGVGAIQLVQLDGAKNVTSSSVKFNAGNDADGLTDGIAFDASDDTLYFKPDASLPIHHYTTSGAKLADRAGPPSDPNHPCSAGVSGLALGGTSLYEGRDGCSLVFVTDKATNALQLVFSTQVAGDPNFRDEGLTCDPNTFSAQGKQVMWSKEAYTPMRAHAYEIPAGSCGVGGQPVAVKLTTKASASVPVGGQIFDTATLSGGASPTGTITFKLYGPGDTTCARAIDTSTAAVNGNGDYASALYRTTATGTYRWVASYDGDGKNPAAGPTSCADAAEQVVVTPQIMTGRAFGVAAKVTLPLASVTVVPTPDTGAVSTSTAGTTSTPCTVTLNAGVVTATALCANVTTALGPARSTASASAANAIVVTGIPGVPTVAVTGVKATSSTACAGSAGATTIESLTIGGVAQSTAAVGPNSVVSLGGPLAARLVLNEQTPVSGGLTVNAVHLIAPAAAGISADVIIASATSDIHNCP